MEGFRVSYGPGIPTSRKHAGTHTHTERTTLQQTKLLNFNSSLKYNFLILIFNFLSGGGVESACVRYFCLCVCHNFDD